VTHTYTVTIARKPGLSDPEGATTHKALIDLGFSSVQHVSFGRVITVSIDAPEEEAARQELDAMCQQLLANPVIEHYTIEHTS
jgi:phosphoribosylformylglycinamidine synthase PurS subunit